MRRHHDYELPVSLADALVQGIAESEIVAVDANQFVSAIRGNVAGTVVGSGIDDNNLKITVGLTVEPVKRLPRCFSSLNVRTMIEVSTVMNLRSVSVFTMRLLGRPAIG